MARIANLNGQRINRVAAEPALPDAGAEWSVARSLGGEPGPIGLVGNFDLASGRDVLNVTTMTAAQGAFIQSYAAIDFLGRSTASGDVNGDGHVDLIVGAGNQAFVIFGSAAGIPATVSLATLPQAAGFVMLGGTDDDAGYSVAAADINNDGYDDVIVGARTGNTGSASLGEAYVIYGHAGPFGTLDGAGRGVIDLTTFTAAVGFVAPRDSNSNSGLAVASAGDVNNDGFEDILLGGHLVYGHAGGFGTPNGAGRAILDLTTSSVTILGDQDGVNAGASVASAGDLNADGFDDFIIGAPMGIDDTAPFQQGGEYYVVFGKAAAFTSPIDLGALAPADGFFIRNAGLFFGEGSGFAQPDITGLTRGSSAAPAGDVNGDGFVDIILNRGAFGGGALVLFGHAGGFGTVDSSGRAQIDGAAVTPSQGFYIPLSSNIGFDVSGAGDFNGDGFADVIVSRMFSSLIPGASRRGEAYLVYGGATVGHLDENGRQIVDLDHLSPADGFMISDNMALSGLATSLSGVGDLNGDGFDDILVGAPHLSNKDGGAYVIYGRALPDPGAILGTPGPDSNLTGTAGNDEIHGLAGNDSIDGLAGADEMYGGDGDDFYFVDNANDLVIEGRNGGNDVIIASLSYALLAGSEVEYLITSNAAGTGAIDFTGNELDNQLWGNAGANSLSGGGGRDTLFGFAGNDILDGGALADQMFGGAGDDLYLVDGEVFDNGSPLLRDHIVEAAGEGFDIVVVASGYYLLTAGAHIELMTTGWIEGTAAVTILGNELAQQIWGNASANLIDGGGSNDELFGFGGNDTLYGGDGNDTLFGGTGNDQTFGGLGDDTYFVDNAADLAIENAGEGNDVLAASVDYALSQGASIELMTTGFIAGTGTINLTGSDLDNQIWGNNGTNAIAGLQGNDALFGFGGNDRLDGGLGFDLMVGGDGQDNFVFASALGPNNIDQIADFVAADDTILLDDAVFTALGLGALNPNAFVVGATAADADDRIIYNSANGTLFYDADGNGAGAAVQIATLLGNPALTASDFMVI